MLLWQATAYFGHAKSSEGSNSTSHTGRTPLRSLDPVANLVSMWQATAYFGHAESSKGSYSSSVTGRGPNSNQENEYELSHGKAGKGKAKQKQVTDLIGKASANLSAASCMQLSRPHTIIVQQ